MSQTKITVKVFEKLLRDFDRQIDALFIKRDAFLNHMLQMETAYLADEVKGKRQSARARQYIAGELKRLGTHTVNIAVDRDTADRLNAVVEASNMVRDAFVNRLIVFLRASDSLLRYLGYPRTIDSLRATVEPMPTSPLKAIEAVHADPLYYIRAAALERFESGLYLLPLPRQLVAFSCYLDDSDVPGTASNAAKEKEIEDLSRALGDFEKNAFARKLPKVEEKKVKHAIHTSDIRRAKRIWLLLGGSIVPVRATGEARYLHPNLPRSVRANDRRKDVPAVLLSRINQLLRQEAANDPLWHMPD